MSAALLCSCGGPTRSAAAVCHVWNTDAVALHNKYSSDAKAGGFTAFLDVVTAPNDLATLMDKMAAVAPTDIEPDFQALGDALHKEVSDAGNALTNPLGSLASGLVSGLSVLGSERRVNQYLEANCAGSPGIPAKAAVSRKAP